MDIQETCDVMDAQGGETVDGSGWVISFTLSFGLEGGTQIRFDKKDEYLSEVDRLNELFNVIL